MLSRRFAKLRTQSLLRKYVRLTEPPTQTVQIYRARPNVVANWQNQ